MPWPGRKPPWATPADPPVPASAVSSEVLRVAVEAAGLDREHRAPPRPGVLWAADWQPPALTARQALHEITQACADCAAVDPISAEGAPAVLARMWPVAPAVRALVALRVASYDELHQDTEAYHLGSLADVAWWSGELLDCAQRGAVDLDWQLVSRGARWAKSLGEVRFAHPLRAEMGQVANAISAFCRDAAFGASLTPVVSLTAPERAEVIGATARLSLVGGAALIRAFALDLPAAAALIAGAPRADGLRLVPGPSRSAAAITVSLDRWLRRLIIHPDLRDALDRVSEVADRVARTYMSHPDPGGHAYGPPDEAFDGPGMDLLEARVADLVELVAAPSDLTGLAPPLDAALDDAVTCARGLRAGRGWGYWNEQALALEGLARLCSRLVAARAIARRDA